MLTGSNFFKIPCIMLLLFCVTQQTAAQNGTLPANIYQANKNAETRWSSFENIKAEKSKGGMENNAAKGHAFDAIPAGASKPHVGRGMTF